MRVITGKRLAAAAITVFLAVLAVTAVSVTATARLHGDIFTETGGVFLTRNYRPPSDLGFSDDRRGLLITSDDPDAVLTTETMSGVLDAEFRVISSVTGRNDLNYLDLTFTDESGAAFTLHINMNVDKWGVSEGYGRTTVRLPGKAGGYGYDGGKLTTTGVYTTGSFCNLDAPATAIRFDPQEMKVSILTTGAYYTVLKLADENDMKTAGAGSPYASFRKYTVSMQFGGLAEAGANRPANVLLYSLNGQSMGESVLRDDVGPRLFAELEYNGCVNMAYTFPQPLMYDVADGMTEFTGRLDVIGPDGVRRQVEDYTFTPTAAGTYTATYSGAKDAAGHVCTPLSVTLVVLDTHRGFAWESDYPLRDITVGAGSKVRFPGMRAQTLMADDASLGVSAYVEMPTGRFITDDAGDGFFYRFNQSGSFRVVYAAEDVLGRRETRTATVYVTDLPVIENTEVPETYAKGTSFMPPDATAERGGETLPVAIRLLVPDGSVRTEFPTILDKVGVYELEYTADYAGDAAVRSEFFTVRADGTSLFETSRGVTLTPAVSSPSYADSVTGLGVTFTRDNTTLRFGNPVDLTNKTADDILFEYMVTPDTAGVGEFSKIRLKLTDINDSRNYIEIDIVQSTDEGYEHLSLVKTGANGNTLYGWEWSNKVSIASKGTNLTSSFRGKPRPGTDTLTTGKVYLDYAERAVYVSYGADRLKVLDLDLETDVGSGKQWTGFSEGKAYLDITLGGLSAMEADMLILTVNGNNLSDRWPTAAAAPEFTLDDETPPGLVGQRYPIAKATAKDEISGDLPVDIAVYYLYGEQGQIEIPVSGGAFIPTTAGEYTILYTCENRTLEKRVKAEDSLPPLTFEWLTSFEENGIVGQSVLLPGYRTGGGSGETSAEIVITGGGETYHNVTSFTPDKEDVYTVTATVTDYLGQTETFLYEIDVRAASNPVFTTIPALPQALLADKTWTVPVFAASVFAADGVSSPATITVVATAGEKRETLTPGNGWKPSELLPEGGTATLVITAANPDDETAVTVRNETIMILPPAGREAGFMRNYFYDLGNNAQISAQSSYLSFSANEAMRIAFAGALPAFNVVFSVPADADNLEAVEFVLTDVLDINRQLTLRVERGEETAILYAAGVRVSALPGTFGSNDRLDFTLDGNTLYLRDDSELGVVEADDYGLPFKGFSAGGVYVGIRTVTSAGGTAEVRFYELGFQPLSNASYELAGPSLTVNGTYPATAGFGETQVVYTASAIDVLSDMTGVEVTVLGPDGNRIIDSRSAAEELTFAYNAYGLYSIVYTAYDSEGNYTETRFSVNVYDLIPPELTVGAVPETVSAGRVWNLPSYEVSDNSGAENVTVYVFVLDPDGCITNENDLEYTPEKAGTYYLYYYAVDKNESYVIREFAVQAV